METPTVIRPETEDDWHEARADGIGSSEVAALFGESPYVSRYTLWAQKVGLVDAQIEETDGMWLGKRMEPIISDLFARQQGRKKITAKIEDPKGSIYVHPEHDYLRATPDRFAVLDGAEQDGRGILELKHASTWAPGWDGSKPPLHYQLQLAHQLMVTGCEWGMVAALVGGFELVVWPIQRRPKIEQMIRVRAARFWALVEKGRAVVDGAKRVGTGALRDVELELGADAKDIKAIQEWHEAEPGTSFDVDSVDEASDAVDLWITNAQREKIAKAAKEGAKATAILHAGDAETIIWGEQPAAKRNAKGAWVLDRKAAARVMGLLEKTEISKESAA